VYGNQFARNRVDIAIRILNHRLSTILPGGDVPSARGDPADPAPEIMCAECPRISDV